MDVGEEKEEEERRMLRTMAVAATEQRCGRIRATMRQNQVTDAHMAHTQVCHSHHHIHTLQKVTKIPLKKGED